MNDVQKVIHHAKSLFGDFETIHVSKGKVTKYRLPDGKIGDIGALGRCIREHKHNTIVKYMHSLGASLQKNNNNSYYFVVHGKQFRVSNHKICIFYKDRTFCNYVIKYYTDINIVIEDINNRIQSLITY